MKWYEETLADTLEFSLMTDFHGCVKPSGRERTWPHEVAREAIRGHEWHITRYSRVLPPEHDCILPFNRLVQGHADYTPMVFEKKELQGYSWARELDFLGADNCELLGFADAEDRPDGYRIDRRAVGGDEKIELTLRPCGGYCARIAPITGSTIK